MTWYDVAGGFVMYVLFGTLVALIIAVGSGNL